MTTSEQKKISLTRKELFEVRHPLWACFGKYDQVGCGLDCPKRTHIFCCKVTLFLKGQR